MKSSVCYVLKNIPCFNITTVLKETFPCKGKSIIKWNLKTQQQKIRCFMNLHSLNSLLKVNITLKSVMYKTVGYICDPGPQNLS